ncbi:MAG: FKBP-type peptidyl-prolyl cis-trans isomerase [Thermodesulfobacteriota bacterium]
MTQAKQGDTVRVHYTGTLADGSVFETSEGRAPLEFTIGEGKVIAGFEKAVIGMSPGESRDATMCSEDAYGIHREDMVIVVDRHHVPADVNPEVGLQLYLKHESGNSFPVMVTAVSEESVTLDANHPLAGKDLTFHIVLVEIV